jgi:hypothetical protein
MHFEIFRLLEDMTNVNMYDLEMNSSKLTSVLSQSSRVFVPIDDPALDFFREAAEVNVPLKNVTFSNFIFSNTDGLPWQWKQEKYCRSVFR